MIETKKLEIMDKVWDLRAQGFALAREGLNEEAGVFYAQARDLVSDMLTQVEKESA